MNYPTVEITSVVKTFGPTVALGGANLRAFAGEVHAIVGGNGSGKSTLAKVISGVLIPDSGQVSILGKTATSPVEARQMGIANVFQEVLVADACSVLDNLYLGADGLFSSSMNTEDKVKKADALMRELLGVEIDLSVPVGDLPLSVRQWITIARALLTEPKVLILDESSAALDFESTERLFKKMRQLKTKGTSILIVTHRTAELVRIADRATVLRDGVDVGCLERHEITESRILQLIAGDERTSAESSHRIAPRLSPQPVMRVTEARVWPEAAPLSLTLYPGEVVGVTGLDGHGQADFVRCLVGIQSLPSGRVSVVRDKKAYEITDLASARKHALGYVSGDRKKEGIFANLSIFENLAMPIYHEQRLGGFLNLINTSKLGPIFEWETSKLAVRMGDRGNPITSLSGGNQQKVLIARAFAEKPAILVLNDPARGIDVGAKLDLYRNLREFASRGNAVVFLSSEIEEFLELCTRVLVFRNGTISTEFEPPYDGHAILNAMFGRRADAALTEESAEEDKATDLGLLARPSVLPRFVDGRPEPRPIRLGASDRKGAGPADEPFRLWSPEIPDGSMIPPRYAEANKRSPRLIWSGPPAGTRSFALAVTDPDLPAEFNFPRAFAHWLVHSIPAETRELAEGASGTGRMPAGSIELNSDFVTFRIPGFGTGYGGPWPPDRPHRYIFTIYALRTGKLELAADADLNAFAAAVLPATITSASFTATYGPAREPLPAPQAASAQPA
ncbi:MAG: YbhB/YbcL family Raf kinase inhibitor-like protein [Hyphomicrobiaceae bacterium]